VPFAAGPGGVHGEVEVVRSLPPEPSEGSGEPQGGAPVDREGPVD
jgi:hypothetical protein